MTDGKMGNENISAVFVNKYKSLDDMDHLLVKLAEVIECTAYIRHMWRGAWIIMDVRNNYLYLNVFAFPQGTIQTTYVPVYG